MFDYAAFSCIQEGVVFAQVYLDGGVLVYPVEILRWCQVNLNPKGHRGEIDQLAMKSTTVLIKVDCYVVAGLSADSAGSDLYPVFRQ